MNENNLRDKIKALFSYSDNNTNEVCDLTTKEGLDHFNELVDKCLNDESVVASLVKSLTGFDNDTLEALKELAQEIFTEANPKEEKNIPSRPSESLDNTDVKMQIHSLVDEYTKEYVCPYFDKSMSNDIYAGLFEFACWIFNHRNNK